MNYSSIGKRLVAFLVDSFLTFMIGVWLIIITDEWYFGLSSLIIGAAYYILSEGSSWHATPGKKLMGIMVVDENGQGIDYSKAAARYLGRLLSAMIFGIGYLLALFDDRNQALHDILAHTFVVDNAFAGSGSASGRSVVGVTGELAGVRFPITGNGVMIGRDRLTCQIVLHRSNGISRLHCFVSYNPASNMFIITDRNSKYGTYTEKGVRVTPEKSVALKSGERFYLGSKDTMFEVV